MDVPAQRSHALANAKESELRRYGGLSIPLKIETDAFVAHLDAQGA